MALRHAEDWRDHTLVVPAHPTDTAHACSSGGQDVAGAFSANLHELNISYTLNITQSPSYFQHYMQLIEPNPTQLVQNAQYGGCLIPLDVIQQNNSQLTDAVQRLTADAVTFVGIGLNVSSSVTGNIWNSVPPAWRTAALSVILNWPVGANLTEMKILAGRMMTEQADLQQPDWKQAFFGSNYNSLHAIKPKYNPFRTFNAPTSVGSDDGKFRLMVVCARPE
ncbi:hypothetical protein PENARI_c003G05330 [Penicillium arizonense]|uniref:Berberine/berberine-like domain-containing protein n=1 Tax=Penicillium arizonense TaxID=1835702 RepID=A0A1F5LTU5_PENAI|nr:hypothetical protein PENARI_c003G05330 [Penicillium arizonense]OGE56470.1 hypothetical protein PENARI_c003G05330 [Penicillium arizonense]